MVIIPYRDENPSRTAPLLTLALIAANTYVFARYCRPGAVTSVATHFGFSLASLAERPQVMVTSLFIHSGWLHLLSNMWFLWLFGDNMEDRFGRLPFLSLYLLAGVAGNLVNAALSMGDPATPVIGASGAVAGVMGAYAWLFPRSRLRCLLLLVFYPILVRLRAFWFVGLWMTGEFLAAYFGMQDFIAHWAHLGGFGFGLAWAMGRRGRRYAGYWR